MELHDALRTTGAIRDFRPEPVPDEVLHRVLDTARFAPSGGNRQGWRVVVAPAPHTPVRLPDLSLAAWDAYLAPAQAGLGPWAPTTTPATQPRATPPPPPP